MAPLPLILALVVAGASSLASAEVVLQDQASLEADDIRFVPDLVAANGQDVWRVGRKGKHGLHVFKRTLPRKWRSVFRIDKRSEADKRRSKQALHELDAAGEPQLTDLRLSFGLGWPKAIFATDERLLWLAETSLRHDTWLLYLLDHDGDVHRCWYLPRDWLYSSNGASPELVLWDEKHVLVPQRIDGRLNLVVRKLEDLRPVRSFILGEADFQGYEFKALADNPYVTPDVRRTLVLHDRRMREKYRRMKKSRQARFAREMDGVQQFELGLDYNAVSSLYMVGENSFVVASERDTKAALVCEGEASVVLSPEDGLDLPKRPWLFGAGPGGFAIVHKPRQLTLHRLDGALCETIQLGQPANSLRFLEYSVDQIVVADKKSISIYSIFSPNRAQESPRTVRRVAELLPPDALVTISTTSADRLSENVEASPLGRVLAAPKVHALLQMAGLYILSEHRSELDDLADVVLQSGNSWEEIQKGLSGEVTFSWIGPARSDPANIVVALGVDLPTNTLDELISAMAKAWSRNNALPMHIRRGRFAYLEVQVTRSTRCYLARAGGKIIYTGRRSVMLALLDAMNEPLDATSVSDNAASDGAKPDLCISFNGRAVPAAPFFPGDDGGHWLRRTLRELELDTIGRKLGAHYVPFARWASRLGIDGVRYRVWFAEDSVREEVLVLHREPSDGILPFLGSLQRQSLEESPTGAVAAAALELDAERVATFLRTLDAADQGTAPVHGDGASVFAGLADLLDDWEGTLHLAVSSSKQGGTRAVPKAIVGWVCLKDAEASRRGMEYLQAACGGRFAPSDSTDKQGTSGGAHNLSPACTMTPFFDQQGRLLLGWQYSNESVALAGDIQFDDGLASSRAFQEAWARYGQDVSVFVFVGEGELLPLAYKYGMEHARTMVGGDLKDFLCLGEEQLAPLQHETVLAISKTDEGLSIAVESPVGLLPGAGVTALIAGALASGLRDEQIELQPSVR